MTEKSLENNAKHEIYRTTKLPSDGKRDDAIIRILRFCILETYANNTENQQQQQQHQ